MNKTTRSSAYYTKTTFISQKCGEPQVILQQTNTFLVKLSLGAMCYYADMIREKTGN